MPNERGFTLLEAVIVILLLAVAAGVAVIALGQANHGAQGKSVGTLPAFFQQAQTQAMSAEQNCPGLLLFNQGMSGDPWLVTFTANNRSCAHVTVSGLEGTCTGSAPTGIQATCISLPAGAYFSPGLPQLPAGWWVSPQTATVYNTKNTTTHRGPLLVTFNNDGSLSAPLLPPGTVSFTFNVSDGHAVSYTVYNITGLITSP